MKTLENFVANSAITRQKESVIRNLVRTADSHGFTPKCVDDGGAVLYTLDEESVLDVVFSVNCSEVFFSGYGTHHSVEIDLSSCPSEIIADTSNHPKWEKCLKTVEQFCEALQEPQGIKYVIDSDSSGYFCYADGTVIMSFVTLINSDQQRNMEANAQRFVRGFNCEH